MNFVERNANFVAEVSKDSHLLSEGEEIGRSVTNEGRVISLGNYHSNTVQSEIGLVLKKSKYKEDELTFMFPFNLYMLNLIWEEGDDELKSQLPLLYGLVKDKEKDIVGELLDDFAFKHIREGYVIPEGGIPNDDSIPNATYRKISTILNVNFGDNMKYGLDSDELRKSIFNVNGENRIGDVPHLFTCMHIPIGKFSRDERFAEFQKSVNLEDFVLKL